VPVLAGLSLVWAPSSAADLVSVISDPLSTPGAQHRTAVEPDSFAFGATVVVAAQVGRTAKRGSSGIAVARSGDGGATWSSAVLPGLTKPQGGRYVGVTDPSVAYDPRRDVWLVSSLGIPRTGGYSVLVSRSTDGGVTWEAPRDVARATGKRDYDKNWTVCDTHPGSPYRGRCYTQWDDFSRRQALGMAWSEDGGRTWKRARTPDTGVLGGQPLVQPDGRLVMPIANTNATRLYAFVSEDGGRRWTGPSLITKVRARPAGAGLRADPLPSAEIAGDGRVYVVWTDCRFRRGCRTNDIVLSRSTNGRTWSAPLRVPVTRLTSGAEHVAPALAVDPSSSGPATRLALTYYEVPASSAGCRVPSCRVSARFAGSADAGATWTARRLSGPFNTTWMPEAGGRMLGDYIATSFVGAGALPFFADPRPLRRGAKDCSRQRTSCDQPIVTTDAAIPVSGIGPLVTRREPVRVPAGAAGAG
jgi:hypothetical protein